MQTASRIYENCTHIGLSFKRFPSSYSEVPLRGKEIIAVFQTGDEWLIFQEIKTVAMPINFW